MCEIREERDVEPAETTLLPRGVHPGQVSEVGIHGAGQHLCTDLLELRHPVIEGEDLRRTDEGEVQRVEEEDHVLPLRDAVSQRQDDQVEISPL